MTLAIIIKTYGINGHDLCQITNYLNRNGYINGWIIKILLHYKLFKLKWLPNQVICTLIFIYECNLGKNKYTSDAIACSLLATYFILVSFFLLYSEQILVENLWMSNLLKQVHTLVS